MNDVKKLRRTVIAAGAGILVLAAIWRIGGDAFAEVGARLSPANDPAILKLATVVAAAQGDAATIRVIAGFAAASVDTADRQAAKGIGTVALGFTDQVEPAARSVGMSITAPTPAPAWLIPCFRDVQITVQAAGTTIVQWGSDLAPETPANVEAAVRGLTDLASLLDIITSTSTVRGSAPPAATDSSHVGARLTDPRLACEQIHSLSEQTAAALP
jgi:hypothetical protein